MATIAVNAAIVGLRPTGLGITTLQMIKALDALGERLTVFTSCPEAVEATHARVVRVSSLVRPEHGARGHLARLLWIETALRWHIRRTRPAMLLNLMPEGFRAPPLPQVTMVHDVLPLHYPTEYPRQQYYFRHYVPGVLGASGAVIISSESTRRDIHRLYPRIQPARVRVVPLGYDVTRFTPAPSWSPATPPYALFLGNIIPHKNVGRLVDAFSALPGRVDARLVIRGWGRRPHVEALRAQIDALGIGNRIDWQPYADAATLPDLYRRARVLLLPSLYEGFGLTTLEAMACGTPVLTSNVSSLPEVVGDAGLLVDPLDTKAIADAMARIFGDDALARDLRERGLARARLFSWERTARALQAALRDASTLR